MFNSFKIYVTKQKRHRSVFLFVATPKLQWFVIFLENLLVWFFQHPSHAIVKGAGLVTRALVEEGSGGVGSRIQGLALAEAALPRHLLTALYDQTRPRHGNLARLHHRHLARHLVALWLVDHPPAADLLRRIMVRAMHFSILVVWISTVKY